MSEAINWSEVGRSTIHAEKDKLRLQEEEKQLLADLKTYLELEAAQKRDAFLESLNKIHKQCEISASEFNAHCASHLRMIVGRIDSGQFIFYYQGGRDNPAKEVRVIVSRDRDDIVSHYGDSKGEIWEDRLAQSETFTAKLFVDRLMSLLMKAAEPGQKYYKYFKPYQPSYSFHNNNNG